MKTGVMPLVQVFISISDPRSPRSSVRPLPLTGDVLDLWKYKLPHFTFDPTLFTLS